MLRFPIIIFSLGVITYTCDGTRLMYTIQNSIMKWQTTINDILCGWLFYAKHCVLSKNALHFFSRFRWHNSFVAIARVLLIGRLAECHQKLSSTWRSERCGCKKFLLSKHFVKTIRFAQFGTNQSLDILLPRPLPLDRLKLLRPSKSVRLMRYLVYILWVSLLRYLFLFSPFNSLHLSLIQTKR